MQSSLSEASLHLLPPAFCNQVQRLRIDRLTFYKRKNSVWKGESGAGLVTKDLFDWIARRAIVANVFSGLLENGFITPADLATSRTPLEQPGDPRLCLLLRTS